MMTTASLLRRVYVRQRPTYRQNVAIAPSPPLRLWCQQRHRVVSALNEPQRQYQQWSLRQSGSLATTTGSADKYPISSSNSSNNLPQSSDIDSNNNLPATCIDFNAASKIEGEESHIVTITLRPGETLRAESGSMIYMTEGVICKYYRLVRQLYASSEYTLI